jgi:hypothetical protein
MGAIASMLEAGDGSAYMNPADLEARTAAETEAVGITEEEADQDKPSFNALTASEMNVRIIFNSSLLNPGIEFLIHVSCAGRQIRVSSHCNSS